MAKFSDKKSKNIRDVRGKQSKPTRGKELLKQEVESFQARSYPRDATPEMREKAKALGLSSSLSYLDSHERKSQARRRTRMERIPRG